MPESSRDPSAESGARRMRPPVGHVIGHEVGEPLPPPRGPGRPFGRIGPYADVAVHTEGRPVGHWIGHASATSRDRVRKPTAVHP
jgi:hypothetical protein